MSTLVRVSLNSGWLGSKPTRRKGGRGLEHNGKYVNTAYGWENVELPYEEVFEALTGPGQSICAQLKGGYRCNDNFLSTNLILVDIDHGLTIEQAQRHYLYEYSAGFYASPSHTPSEAHFRLLFRLVDDITSADDMHYLYTGLITELGGDRACNEPARFFYGNPTSIKECRPHVTLPPAVARLLLGHGKSLVPPAVDSKPPKPLSKEHKTYFLAKLQSMYLGNYGEWYRLAVAMRGAGFSVEEFVAVTLVVMSAKTAEDAAEQWARIERDPKHNFNFGYAINLLKAKGVDLSDMPRQSGGRLAEFEWLSDVETKPILWLWKNRIPLGAVTLIYGPSGTGKSHVAAFLAGVVSKGGAWPVAEGLCKQGSVIYIDRENPADKVLAPRLEATGAVLTRCARLTMVRETKNGHVQFEDLDLLQDIGVLDDLMHRVKNVALVIIDPITDYLGKTDANNNAEVRRVIGHLNTLAEKHECAIVGINHTNKNTHLEARNRAMGSVGFISASRATFVVSEDKEDPRRYLFTPDKANLGAKQKGCAFVIETVGISGNLTSTCCSWEETTHDITADEALSPRETEKGRPPSKINDAIELINKLLENGPIEATKIKLCAEEQGISWRTMARAKKQLGIVSKEVNGGWVWCSAPF